MITTRYILLMFIGLSVVLLGCVRPQLSEKAAQPMPRGQASGIQEQDPLFQDNLDPAFQAVEALEQLGVE